MPALDGLRTVSVSLVVVSHLAAASSIRFTGDGVFADLIVRPAMEELGRLGVYLFFVISGFVICRGLLAEGRPSLRGFYIRRFFRIVPPLAIYVSGVFLLMLAGLLPVELSILRALTFTCNFGGCGAWYGAHTWSLSVEEQFYLIMPVAFLLLAARRRSILTWTPLALMLLIAVIALFSSSRVLEPFLLISFGVACAMNEDMLRAVTKSAPRWLFPVLIVLSLMAMRLSDTRFHLVGLAALAPLLAAVVMWTAFREPPLLKAGPMVAVGKVSYTIYLWQQIAVAPYDGAGWPFYFVTVSACVLWAFASYRWIEGPLISYAKRPRLAQPQFLAASGGSRD